MSERHLRSGDGNQEEPAASARRSSGSNGGSGIEARLASLETRTQCLATKEDIQKVKVWCLLGVPGGMAIAASLAVGILKLFFS